MYIIISIFLVLIFGFHFFVHVPLYISCTVSLSGRICMVLYVSNPFIYPCYYTIEYVIYIVLDAPGQNMVGSNHLYCQCISDCHFESLDQIFHFVANAEILSSSPFKDLKVIQSITYSLL